MSTLIGLYFRGSKDEPTHALGVAAPRITKDRDRLFPILGLNLHWFPFILIPLEEHFLNSFMFSSTFIGKKK